MNWRLLFAAVGSLMALVIVGAAEAHQHSSGPQFPANFAIGNLPPAAIGATEAAGLSSVLGRSSAGITSASLNGAKAVANTPVGRLFLVPGETGSCLASTTAASCVGLADGAPLVALASSDAKGFYVGGGVVRADVKSVTVRSANSPHNATFSTVAGFFTIRESDHFAVSDGELIFTPHS